MKKLFVFGAAIAAMGLSSVVLAAAAAPAPTPPTKKGPTEFVYSCTPQAQPLVKQAFDLAYQAHGPEALALLEDARKADPNCIAARYLLGSWGEGAESKKMADEAFVAAAKLPEAERTLIETLEAMRQGDVTNWNSKAKKLVELQPDSWLAHLQLAFVAQYQQQLDTYLAETKKATELNPSSGVVWNMFGYANVALKKSDDAIAAFRKYTEVAPNEANAHDSLADALLDVNKLDEAEAEYRKAVEVSAGKFYSSWSGVAAVRCLKTDWQGCRDALAKQKAGEPRVEQKAMIDRNVAWSWIAQGKAKDGLKVLDAAEKEYTAAKSPNAVAGVRDERAWALLLTGKNAEALKAAEALEKADQSAMTEGAKRMFKIDVAAIRAMTLARTNKVADAEEALTAVDTDLKAAGNDLWLQSTVGMGRAEIALAKKDAKAAPQALAMCPELFSLCRYQLALAQDKAGDKEAAKATRETLLAHPQRNAFYSWVRNQIDTKKVTKQEPTAAADKPVDKKGDKKAADKKQPAAEKKPVEKASDKPATKQ
jgi:tetratricopeptide (TPR) repeat protein